MANSSPVSQSRRQQLYFAYGSNLHLGQMAKRCTQSRYIGTASLRNYRFQINERGYANLLPSAGHYVEGLVYLLSLTDEERLDKNEAVPTAYQKKYLRIKVSTAAIEHVGRAVSELDQAFQEELNLTRGEAHMLSTMLKDKISKDSIVQLSGQSGAQPPNLPIDQDLARGHDEHFTGYEGQDAWQTDMQVDRATGQLTIALVYLSENYITDADPRTEYIGRMNAGIDDAHRLGMSVAYIETYLRPKIPARDAPDQAFRSSQQQPSEHRSGRVRRSIHSSNDLSRRPYHTRYEPPVPESSSSENRDRGSAAPDY